MRRLEKIVMMLWFSILITALTAVPSYAWTSQTGAGQRFWSSIASSSDGTRLAAVVAGGWIYTSADSGYTWTTPISAIAGGYWVGIASSSDGTKLAAANMNLYICTSSNSGATWQQRTSAGRRGWAGIASSADGTKLAAVARAFAGEYIYTSSDSGATWTQRTSAGQRPWQGIASSSDGTKLGAIVYDAAHTYYIYTSCDSGATWTQMTSAGQRYWLSIASSSDGTKLAAVDNGGYIYTSCDSGATWLQRTGAGQHNWYSITSSSDGTNLAAVDNGGYIYSSLDSGATWTQRTSAGQRNWRSIASSADGSKLAAAVYGGYVYTSAPILDQTVSLANGTLTINYAYASPQPCQWNLWLFSQNQPHQVFSMSLPLIDTTQQTSYTIPNFPTGTGTIGLLSTFYTSQQGITAWAFSDLYTGPPPPTQSSNKELSDVFPPQDGKLNEVLKSLEQLAPQIQETMLDHGYFVSF